MHPSRGTFRTYTEHLKSKTYVVTEIFMFKISILNILCLNVLITRSLNREK